MKIQSTHKLSKIKVAGILMGVALLMIACNLNFIQSKSVIDETEVASVIESTLDAEWAKATEAALAVTEAPSAQPTSPPPTDTLPPVEITLEPTAEIQPSPSSAASDLTAKWYTWFTFIHWVPLSTGCENMSVPCYKLIDDIKILEGEFDAILTAGNDIRIEESWPNPYLVYGNQRSLKYQASINLIVDGNPIVGKFLPTGEVNQWKEEYLDLSEFKGKKIRIQVICPVGRQKVNSWIINNMRIVPDYDPN